MDVTKLYNSVMRGQGLDELNLTWRHKVGKIRQETCSNPYTRGRSFYTTPYRCPKCDKSLEVALASISVKTTEQKSIATRMVFACFDCQNLFAVEGLKRLDGGEYYTMDDTHKFTSAAQIIDSTATSSSEFMLY